MDRGWVSQEVVVAILDALGDDELRVTEIAARIDGARPEVVARHVGVMASDGLLTRRQVERRDLYRRTGRAPE